jgi:alkanesulfonate monooxygenase SsuD/methylene tetrahydromethanopterin reductase-like flavin-dependent oxidoreductase (luciferase family)
VFVGVSCGDEFWGLDVFGAAERLGFDGLFAGERMIVHRPSWDVVTMCTAIACATERITVGAAAAVAPFRHPTVLAKELTGLDRISGGRLVVGVAAGGDDPVEFEAAGAAVETRQRWTTETVEILKRYFSGARFDYDGKLFSLRGVRMNPPPARPGGPPGWIAGRGTRSQRRAARVGDGFLPYLVTPKQCARLFGEVRELAGELGRELGPGYAFGAYLHLALGEDGAEARRRADEHLAWRYSDPRFAGELAGRYPVAGDADGCAERLSHYADAGCTHAVLFLIRRQDEPPLAGLEHVADELLPRLRSLGPRAGDAGG